MGFFCFFFFLTNHNVVVQVTVCSLLRLEQAQGQQTVLNGSNGRAEVLSWLLGSREVAGAIMSQGQGRHHQEGRCEESRVGTFNSERPYGSLGPCLLWCEYGGVRVEAGLRGSQAERQRVKEQKEWTWAYTCVTITGDSTYERQEGWAE